MALSAGTRLGPYEILAPHDRRAPALEAHGSSEISQQPVLPPPERAAAIRSVAGFPGR